MANSFATSVRLTFSIMASMVFSRSVSSPISARIWNNRTKLVREIKQTMLTAIHRGSSIQQLSKALARRMEVGYNDAERLVRTELNAVENRASADAMRDAEFEYYQFVATLDRRTCARCGEHDGEIYRLTEMHQGENAPPLHARCRCTIVATDDAPNARHKPAGERAARDYGNNPKTKSFAETISSLGGKGGERGEPSHVKTPFGTVNVGGKFDFPKTSGEPKSRRKRVPADMTYTQWKAIYIDKTKTFAQWQTEMDAKYAAAPPTKEQLRGRAIIEKLAVGLPVETRSGKIIKIKEPENLSTSALTDKNDPDGKRRSTHAKIFYEKRRNSKKDPWVKRIAQNSGMSEKIVSKIFDHVFITEHDLDDGWHTFYPSYYMAESFRRLHEGKNIQPHDLILLKHEWLELGLMKRYGYDYDTAHTISSRKYNYSSALKDWCERNGVPWSG